MEQEQVDKFIEEWPKVSFVNLANEQVEGGRAVKIFYKSFFTILELPEAMITSLLTLLKARI